MYSSQFCVIKPVSFKKQEKKRTRCPGQHVEQRRPRVLQGNCFKGLDLSIGQLCPNEWEFVTEENKGQ